MCQALAKKASATNSSAAMLCMHSRPSARSIAPATEAGCSQSMAVQLGSAASRACASRSVAEPEAPALLLERMLTSVESAATSSSAKARRR